MRPIKFRGKSLYNGKWVYGNLRIFRERAYISAINCHAQSEVDLATVGQYTGLKDTNGADVYEGDILEAIYKYEQVSGSGGVIPDCDCICKGIVEWNDEVSGWVLKAQSTEYPMKNMLEENETDLIPLNVFFGPYMGADYANEDMEVIGNIHDQGKEVNNGKHS